MNRGHTPHILRPHCNEWCGGSEPPTTVTIKDEEARVDIYDAGTNLHDGYIHTIQTTERILVSPDIIVDSAYIGNLALRAIQATSKRA